MTDGVLGLHPFVPASDYARSVAFYEALGFTALHRDSSVTVFRLGSFGFILQNFHVEAHTANAMVQLLVRDLEAWWSRLDAPDLVVRFGVSRRSRRRCSIGG